MDKNDEKIDLSCLENSQFRVDKSTLQVNYNTRENYSVHDDIEQNHLRSKQVVI
jgi:hypothetical protein